VALVSWGEMCADPSFPGVNARVSFASDWIDAMVCEMSENPPADFRCHDPRLGHNNSVILSVWTVGSIVLLACSSMVYYYYIVRRKKLKTVDVYDVEKKHLLPTTTESLSYESIE
jgi:secreted trypsin-like serine protease